MISNLAQEKDEWRTKNSKVIELKNRITVFYEENIMLNIAFTERLQEIETLKLKLVEIAEWQVKYTFVEKENDKLTHELTEFREKAAV